MEKKPRKTQDNADNMLCTLRNDREGGGISEHQKCINNPAQYIYFPKRIESGTVVRLLYSRLPSRNKLCLYAAL